VAGALSARRAGRAARSAKSGRPLTHGPEVRARLIALACTSPSDTDEGVRRERWTHAELAAQVGMSESQAHVILRAAELRPHLTEQWVMSELGPEFGAQAAEVCGLDLDPPENAIVLSVDEKTSIAAREPARPDTLPAPRRPARRDSEYLRNGTRNLFAALQVHSGQLSGMTAATRNRWDFIAFLDQLEHEIPDVEGREIVAILDNLSTHKTQEVRDRLAEHPRWRLVFTPSTPPGSTRSRSSSRSSRAGCRATGPSLAPTTSPPRCWPSSSTTTSPPSRSPGPTPARCSQHETSN
jgi:hypothetical protein